MIFYILIAILVLVFLVLLFRTTKREKIERERLEVSLNDGEIYVEDLGMVKYDELEFVGKVDREQAEEEAVKLSKESMFKEGLLEFEGTFLIDGVPLNEERRLSIDDAFLYLQEILGKEVLLNKPTLTLDHPLFREAITCIEDAIPLGYSIAGVMDINPEDLYIDFFSQNNGTNETNYLKNPDVVDAAGLYYGKNEQGKYEIYLADNIHHDLEVLIATIAHEFAHIKLLGENRIEENSEELTDIVTLFYGFGIFNANSVYKFINTNTSWATQTLGYLSQVDWAYLFALYRYVRNEEQSEWMNELEKTIAKECDLAYNFILENPELVLQAGKGE